MVSALGHFEESNLAANIKAALRITAGLAISPALFTDDLWNDALNYFTEQELVDIVLLSMHTTASKATITLGLDPGKEASSRQFYPTEDVYGSSADLDEAIEELRSRGISVDAPAEVRT
jgi:hypothetical protein